MIAHLRGVVAHRGSEHVVIEVGGVGYLVQVTSQAEIPSPGEPIELHTSLQVREDSMTLYGFPDHESLVMFDLLLTASGVGPKLARAALGVHRPQVLRTAIAGGDVATLTLVPGIGKKVAQRLILELKDKMSIPELADEPHIEDVGGESANGHPHAEVRDALLGLGYTASETQRALEAVATEGEVASELLRAALRHLASYDGTRR